MDTFNFNGNTYELIDGNIVDCRTNILVCSDLANKISQTFGLFVKQEVCARERSDVSYLNSMIKSRTKSSS